MGTAKKTLRNRRNSFKLLKVNQNQRSAMKIECESIFEQFMQICRESDIVKAEKFLDDGLVDVNCSDIEGNTPLQISSAFGHSELTELLLTNGADVKLCNNYGFTAMHHAAYNGHNDIIVLLIKYGSSIHAANVFGATPLTLAAKKGNFETVKILIDNGADVEPSFSHFEPSPLMIAASCDQESIVKMLLDNGADPKKIIESTGYTPLMFAALNSQLTLVQLLLDRGADPDVKNLLHQTAFDLAINRRRNDVKALLEQYTTATRSRTSTMVAQRPKLNIIDAVKAEETNRIKEILNKDPSQADFVRTEDGCSPLMLASMLGRLDIVTLLVKKGASLDRQDKLKGWTSLMQAAFFSKVAVAKFLIHSGANVNIRTYDGFTALELASIAGTEGEKIFSRILSLRLDGQLLTLDDYTDVVEDGLLALLSRKEDSNSLASSRKNNFFGGFFSRRLRFTKAKRQASKPKVWWNKLKNRMRHRSNSIGNNLNVLSRRNIPLGHESCLFIDPTKSVLNSNLVFGPSREVWKSQSVCDLHSLRSNLPKSPDPVWGLTTRNYDYLEGKAGVVVPPFHPIMTFGPLDPKTKKRDPQVVVDDQRRHSTFLAAASMNSLDWNSVPNGKISRSVSAVNVSDSIQNGKIILTAETCESDYGGHRSLAMYNASRMRPPKYKPVEPLAFAKYDTFVASLNLNPNTVNHKSLIPSPNSSMSTNSSTLPPPVRKRTPHLAVQFGQPSAPIIGAAKKKNSRGLARPHSYHDAVTESRMVNAAGATVGRRGRGAAATLNSRPHSYHDPDNANLNMGGVSFNDLPITPTRKTFGFFNNSVTPYRISKFNSTPHLTTSPSNSTSGSSSITPNKRSFQVTNPSMIGANFNSTDTLKLDEDYMDYILKQIAAEPYSHVFDDEELDLDTLVTLTDGDLRDLGIQDPGPRNEILKIVRQVNCLIERKRKRRIAENFENDTNSA